MRSFSGWSFIESLFSQDCREVVKVQTITHASPSNGLLDGRDMTIAVIVARRGIIEHACRDHLAFIIHAQLDDLIAVLCFSAISVVHSFMFGYGFL
jgi:hypothetical protein